MDNFITTSAGPQHRLAHPRNCTRSKAISLRCDAFEQRTRYLMLSRRAHFITIFLVSYCTRAATIKGIFAGVACQNRTARRNKRKPRFQGVGTVVIKGYRLHVTLRGIRSFSQPLIRKFLSYLSTTKLNQ